MLCFTVVDVICVWLNSYAPVLSSIYAIHALSWPKALFLHFNCMNTLIVTWALTTVKTLVTYSHYCPWTDTVSTLSEHWSHSGCSSAHILLTVPPVDRRAATVCCQVLKKKIPVCPFLLLGDAVFIFLFWSLCLFHVLLLPGFSVNVWYILYSVIELCSIYAQARTFSVYRNIRLPSFFPVLSETLQSPGKLNLLPCISSC